MLAETPRRYERGKLAEQQIPEDVAVGIPMQLLANRPDVRSAERSLEQAFYATNQARAAFYPSIVLSGSAGWTNSAGGMIVNPGKFLASAVGSLTQPLFNKGQITAQYRIAKAQKEEASLAFQQALLNAGSEGSTDSPPITVKCTIVTNRQPIHRDTKHDKPLSCVGWRQRIK